MTEVEGPRRSSGFPLQGPIPFALFGPASVESPMLPEDIRTKLPSGEMRDQVAPVHQAAVWIGRQWEATLVGDVALAHNGRCDGPGRDGTVLLCCAHGAGHVEQVGGA